MILLSTLNARYIHSSLALRYLYANMGELQQQAAIQEFMVNQRPVDIAEQVLNLEPAIAGFGVYIWNIEQTRAVIAILKSLHPELVIVLGGPEISHETESSVAFDHADYIIRGQADLAFADLCRQLINGNPPADKIIDAPPLLPTDLALPYDHYSEEDIRHRVIYVEASRGCPFTCEFCLSALDKTALGFDIEAFLRAMESLYQRGARHFKFVDRTFNLKVRTGQRILEYFLTKPLHDLNLHFELIPDRLPEQLKPLIQQFPTGCLQFEIGIQTLNPQVQQNISRKQDHTRTLANLNFLRRHTGVHLHTDLIAGLPGEDMQSLARGFDLLVSLQPHEIQLGILKRLRGTPIVRHELAFEMVFNPCPPYNILSTRDMDSQSLFRISRFARYWDLIANSARFTHSLPTILASTPFDSFLALSDWLFASTGQTHQIALPRLFRLLYQYAGNNDRLRQALEQDFRQSGIKSSFSQTVDPDRTNSRVGKAAFSRQRQHLKSGQSRRPSQP